MRQNPLQRLDRVAGWIVGEQRGQQFRVGRGGKARLAALQRASNSRVLTRLPLWPTAIALPRLIRRSAGRSPKSSIRWWSSGSGRWPATRAGSQAPLVEDLGDEAQFLVEHELLAVADARPADSWPRCWSEKTPSAAIPAASMPGSPRRRCRTWLGRRARQGRLRRLRTVVGSVLHAQARARP